MNEMIGWCTKHAFIYRNNIHGGIGISIELRNIVARICLLCTVTASLFLWASDSEAQVAYLDVNSIKAGFATGGVLFSAADTATYTASLSSLLKIEQDSEIATMLSSGFWMTGLDQGGNVKGAASTIYRNKDWATGPISDSYNSSYDSLYNAVFSVTQSQIAYHLAHYNDSGYQIPQSIKQWPGNGRDSLHELHSLAPYVDVNDNNVYDPQNGDYPNICGDEAIFFMLNDTRNVHTEFVGPGMGVQLNVLAFAFHDSVAGNDTAAINHTFFLRLSLFNTSSVNYHGVLFSIFNDYRIGCYKNDRAGCDTTLNTFFAYNGSYPDTGCSSYDTDSNKAAQGIAFLNQQLYSHAVFTAFSDTITPWPIQWQLPLANPRNFQSGYWSDGTPFTVGGDGYGGNVPTHYLFPGNPLNLSDWSDETSGTVAGNRTGIGTVLLDSLAAGQAKNIDVAFVSSFVPSTDTANEILALKERVVSVQNFYASLGQCGIEYTGINNVGALLNAIKVFPNPANTLVYLSVIGSFTKGKILVNDVSGRTVYTTLYDNAPIQAIDVSKLAEGIYFLILQNDTERIVKKFVKE